MMLERVDRVTGPLVVGQFYLVPTVRLRWSGLLRDWPVIGPPHEDREFFNFSQTHYHVDARFLPPDSKRVYHTLHYPLHGERRSGKEDGPVPPPEWRRRKCIRAAVEGFHNPHPAAGEMRRHYAGVQCASNAGGWVCPHRQAPLGSIVPVDGVITCPLHALRIDAATGVVLSR